MKPPNSSRSWIKINVACVPHTNLRIPMHLCQFLGESIVNRLPSSAIEGKENIVHFLLGRKMYQSLRCMAESSDFLLHWKNTNAWYTKTCRMVRREIGENRGEWGIKSCRWAVYLSDDYILRAQSPPSNFAPSISLARPPAYWSLLSSVTIAMTLRSRRLYKLLRED